jgi:hypothetical protein
MRIFKRLLALVSKPKQNNETTTIKFELFGKEYNHTINATPQQVEEALKKYHSSEEYKQKEKLVEQKKQNDDTNRQVEVENSIATTLKALYDIENDRYFSIQKHIDKIKENCGIIAKHFKDGLYEKHKRDGIKKFAIDYDIYEVIPKSTHVFLADPKLFKINLKKFHKVELLNSVDILYQYWVLQVKTLKQKTAKTKRQHYVIDGFENKLKSELLTLSPTAVEIKQVDDMIEKIKAENWSLL